MAWLLKWIGFLVTIAFRALLGAAGNTGGGGDPGGGDAQSTDFSEYTLGASPSDWSHRMNTTYSGSEGWTVVSDGSALGGTTLLQDISVNRMNALCWDDAPTDTDAVEALAKVRFSNNTNILTGYGVGGVALRVADAGETGYSLCNRAGSIARLYRHTAGTTTLVGQASFTFTVDTWYWMRLRAEVSGGVQTFSARVWADGDAEPGTWLFTANDSTYTTGRTGLVCLNAAANFLCDFFSYATDGSSAADPS